MEIPNMSVATAKVKLPNDRTIEIPSRQMVKVLLIDDDREFRHRMRSFLEDKGCSVRIADTPDDAKSLLKPNSYQVIIADIWFRSSDKTGDEFITDNIGLMKDAKVVAVTAKGINMIRNYQELNRLGVEVYEKGHFQFADSMKNLAAGAFEKRVEDISSVVEQAVSSAVGGETAEAKTYPPSYQVLLGELVETMTAWFTSRSGSTEPVLVYKGRPRCCDELATETENGSPLGLEFMKFLVRRFRNDLLRRGKEERAASHAEPSVSASASARRAAPAEAAESAAAGDSQAAADN
jgi:CheY-like chemotaxis protein